LFGWDEVGLRVDVWFRVCWMLLKLGFTELLVLFVGDEIGLPAAVVDEAAGNVSGVIVDRFWGIWRVMFLISVGDI
jgi:hypothetical protein